jgi:pimeloyl-ACP methyl ester carboxylesterase
MPFATLPGSPLAGRPGPVRLFYRQYGRGFPLLFLHGGWGYQVYPFGKQIDAVGRDFSVLIPDRSGYGQSGRIESLPTDFHHRAAAETVALLDALGIAKAVLWGHSDGAVITALLGLGHPERFPAVVMEATHYYRDKPVSSRAFFQEMVSNPESVGERICATLAAEHGQDYWKQIVGLNADTWLKIAAENRATPDLYQGQLGQLKPAALILHGSRDPRTEPDELAAIERELPGALRVIEGGGHSPHSEDAVSSQVSHLAEKLLSQVPTLRKGLPPY